MIHVAGANPNGGGVLTYIKNLSHSINGIQIYDKNECLKFFQSIQNGDTIFLNVVKPSLPFLMLSKLKFYKNITITYCGHGLNYKNNKGIKKFLVKFCEYLISKLSDKIIVLNQKDMHEFLSWNKCSYLIPTSLKPKNIKANCGEISSDISWIAVGCVEERKNPDLFIRIGHAVKNFFPGDTFTWIGDGPLLDNFDIESLESEGIYFKGAIDNDLVRNELSEYDIFICTSSFEVLPISILEAVEAACIICVKDYHYSDDVVSRFLSAKSFKNVDQILEIRKNINILQTLKEGALQEKKSLSESYDNYIDSMKKALNV